MRLALAAELNGYPSPSHLLELADKLDLTAEQRSRVAELNAMKQEAVPLGNRLLEQEARLDHQFADRTSLDEHTVVAARRTALVRPTDDQAGDTIPLRIAQNEPIHDTQGFLLKESLESRPSCRCSADK